MEPVVRHRSTSQSKVDVLILGGGPAGAATALTLKKREPSLSVVLLERSRFNTFRVGESLPPGSQAVLEELDVWEAFQAGPANPCFGVRSAWGQAKFRTDNTFFHASGHGWVMNRAWFDQMLVDRAIALGVDVRRGTRLESAVRSERGIWLVACTAEKGARVDFQARFVVDATGRGASFARQQGASPARYDRLVGCYQLFEGAPSAPTLVECFEDGWWYSASLPNDRRIVVCFSDADLARSEGLLDPSRWMDRLQSTTETWDVVRDGVRCKGPVRTAPAQTQCLDQVAGENWLAVGDAASTYDPLSSQGILKAMRSGVFAAYALADSLDSGDDTHLRKYRRFVADEFEGYLEARADFYAGERRWAARSFWQRRVEPITLDPHIALSHGEVGLNTGSYFFSPAQARVALSECLVARPAFQVVSAFQRRDPFCSAHRIILGLQYMLKIGMLNQGQGIPSVKF